MGTNAKDFIWAEKYRPETVDDILLPTQIKNTLKNYIETQQIPHMLFISGPGRGKTTAAKAICKDLGAECMYINASDDNGIDVLRSRVNSFSKMQSLYTNKHKIVIFDEFDGTSRQLQNALRSPMEGAAKNVRFILTANYAHSISDAIVSRCQVFNFNFDDPAVKKQLIVEVGKRMSDILEKEGVHFEWPVLIDVIVKYYPDIRKLINVLQMFSSQNNKVIDKSILSFDSINMELVTLILQKNWTDSRKYCIERNIGEEFYTFLYNNLLPVLSKQPMAEALLIISEFQYRSHIAADKEIPMAACLMELTRVVP